MKRRFLYYSLVAAMTASAVTFSSCDKDEDEPAKNNGTTTTTTTTTTDENQKKEEGKFSVSVSLNGESILAKQIEAGQKINLDELAAQEALKGYEILSITQDGKEVSGEVEISADAKYEINAIKYAALEYELPEDGKILHATEKNSYQPYGYRYEEGVKRVKLEKKYAAAEPRLISETSIPHTDSWIYTTSDNKLNMLYRGSREVSKNISSLNYAGEETFSYDQTTGKCYYSINNNSPYAVPVDVENEPTGYFFKIGDKYYMATNRFKKSDETVKGYKTTWTPDVEEKAKEKISKDELAPIVVENDDKLTTITITDEKLDEFEYDYENGIITIKTDDFENKFIYDGTYLYTIRGELSYTDYTKLDEGKLLSIGEASLPEDFPSEMFLLTDKNVFVYKPYITNVPQYVSPYFGFYDWNGDNKVNTIINQNQVQDQDLSPRPRPSINSSDMMKEEFRNTLVYKFDKYPFGEFYSIARPPFYIFPDGKIGTYNNCLHDIEENSVFTDGNYVVIDARRYTDYSMQISPRELLPVIGD